MEKLLEKLLIYLTGLSNNGAYLIIFGILVACGLGFPLPEDIPLIAAGYLCWDGTLAFFPAFLVTMAGVLIGDSVLFFLGRRAGMKMLAGKKKFLFLEPKKIRRTRAYFRKYGEKIVFFARFFAGIRGVAFFMAGAMKLRYSRFILLDTLAAIISVPVWVGIGYLLGHWWGEEIGSVLQSVKHLKHWFTGIMLTVVAVILVRFYIKYQKTRKPAKSAKAALARR